MVQGVQRREHLCQLHWLLRTPGNHASGPARPLQSSSKYLSELIVYQRQRRTRCGKTAAQSSMGRPPPRARARAAGRQSPCATVAVWEEGRAGEQMPWPRPTRSTTVERAEAARRAAGMRIDLARQDQGRPPSCGEASARTTWWRADASAAVERWSGWPASCEPPEPGAAGLSERHRRRARRSAGPLRSNADEDRPSAAPARPQSTPLSRGARPAPGAGAARWRSSSAVSAACWRMPLRLGPSVSDAAARPAAVSVSGAAERSSATSGASGSARMASW